MEEEEEEEEENDDDVCWELEKEQKRLVKNVLVLTAVFAPFFLGMLWKLEVGRRRRRRRRICHLSGVCLSPSSFFSLLLVKD